MPRPSWPTLTAVAVLQVAAAALLYTDPLGVALAASSALVLGWVAGFRYGIQATEQVMGEALDAAIAPFPSTVQLTRDEEGNGAALVTTMGGEPKVFAIPDEVSACGPRATFHWAPLPNGRGC